MGYYETYEEGKERWVAEPGDPVNIHGVSYDPNDPWSNWVNAAGQLDVPNWQENLDAARGIIEGQGLQFGPSMAAPGYSRFFDPVSGTWPIEKQARIENAGPFGLPSWTAPLFALAAVGTAGAGSALLGPGAAGAAASGAGSAAAAPAAAGGASILGIPTSTLSTIGTIGSLGGTGANVLGGLTGQDWLQKLGLGLGVAGGLAGGVAGLGNALSRGVSSLSDAAKLASSAGKITGAVGRASGVGPLQQASRYLGLGGNVGNLASGAGNLLSAADVATQRGGGGMANEWGNMDWLDWSGGGEGPLLSDAGPGIDWGSFTSGGPGSFAGQVLTDYANGPNDTGTAGGGSSSGGLLGPLLSSLGSIGGGAIGSNAANEAARLQAQALNRGIDLQTSQWLQQQANLAPYLQAGQGGLAQLQQLAGRDQPGMPGVSPSVRGSDYGLPSPYPGWQPRQFQRPDDVQAANYQWNPQQGPLAANYRYTPGNIPQASQYRYTPGAVPTLSGKELLANDPGVQFRMDEGRKALEASAAARGGLLSGPTLAALQRQGQELSSQEYGQAWNRASQQAQLREQWGQAASQMGWGQAEAESRLREQVNQIASQQGWSQAQAEAAFREGLAQQSQAQNFGQAMAGQQNAYNQGLGAEQWAQRQQEAYSTQLYDRQAQQAQQMYGRDVYSNEQDYARQQAAYRQQLAQSLLPWEQQSVLASLGGNAASIYGTQGGQAASGISNLLAQLGSTQAMGTLGQAGQWNQALAGGVGGLQNILRGLNA